MYKEFDLEKAKNGSKVVLRQSTMSGTVAIHKVRILDFNIKNPNCIVFTIMNIAGNECVIVANRNGKCDLGNLVIEEEYSIPFTIEDYKEGDIVEKDGKRVIIFTVKANGNTPIVGQVGSDERIHLWTEENAKQTLVIIR